ncbi:winged helix-turn-helix transcriptional regulator [Gordonia sesuvii]|uniref:winged helix-turn-helix transcriptional regulator n=1 Tax=Gordonia sesuvii TaxID=3116777 RepID=UPI003D6797EE
MNDDGPEVAGPDVMELQGAFARRDDWQVKGWCRIERALDVIGTKSAMVIVRELLYGGTKFDELARRTQLSDAVASSRLKQLLADGIVERRPYQEPGQRTRYEYVLTDRGRALFPVLTALMDWGEDLEGDPRGGLEVTHRGCGAPVSAVVRCAEGHEVSVDEAAARIRDEAWAVAARERGRKASPPAVDN